MPVNMRGRQYKIEYAIGSAIIDAGQNVQIKASTVDKEDFELDIVKGE